MTNRVFEIRPSPVGGVGAFAVVDIRRGTVIIDAETPYACVRTSVVAIANAPVSYERPATRHFSAHFMTEAQRHFDETALGIAAVPRLAYRMLCRAQYGGDGDAVATLRAAFTCYDTSAVHRKYGAVIDAIADERRVSVADVCTVVRMAEINGFVCDSQTSQLNRGSFAVYTTASRINHRCAPTAENEFDASTWAICVRALVDIRCGDELFVTYNDSLHVATFDDAGGHRIDGGFVCRCTARAAITQALRCEDVHYNRLCVQLPKITRQMHDVTQYFADVERFRQGTDRSALDRITLRAPTMFGDLTDALDDGELDALDVRRLSALSILTMLVSARDGHIIEPSVSARFCRAVLPLARRLLLRATHRPESMLYDAQLYAVRYSHVAKDTLHAVLCHYVACIVACIREMSDDARNAIVLGRMQTMSVLDISALMQSTDKATAFNLEIGTYLPLPLSPLY